MNRSSIAWFSCALMLLAMPMAGGPARACDVCHRLGHSQFHAGFLGADDHEDAMVAPHNSDHNGEATAQFVVQGGKWAQPGGLGTPVTITYSYNNLLDGGLKDINGVSLPVSLLRDSIEEALGLWASVAPLNFVEVPDQGTNPPPQSSYPNGQFGQIRFHHVYINGPDIPGQDPIAKAQAYFPSGGGNLGGDVYFDHADPWQEMGTLSRPDVLGAAIHELGHALGLGHSNLPQANMYWIFTRTSGLGTGALHADDIAGIQTVYGPGVGSVTPLVTVPEPATWLLLLSAAVAIRFGAARRRGRACVLGLAFALCCVGYSMDARAEATKAPTAASRDVNERRATKAQPELAPEDVVRIQLAALAGDEEVDERIRRCYEFASPANRRHMGPIERFAGAVQTPQYAVLLTPRQTLVGNAVKKDDTATVLVSVVDDRSRLVLFRFHLSRQVEMPFNGCWMTDAVLRCAQDRSPPPEVPVADGVPTI